MFVKRIYLLISILLTLTSVMSATSDLRFIENKGQWENQIKYNVRLNFGNIYFEKDKFTFMLSDQGHHHDKIRNTIRTNRLDIISISALKEPIKM